MGDSLGGEYVEKEVAQVCAWFMRSNGSGIGFCFVDCRMGVGRQGSKIADVERLMGR